MTDKELLDIHVLERKKYNLLSEVLDYSQQLGQCMDRKDEVSFRMILSEREGPIVKLEEIKHQIKEKVTALSEEDAKEVRRCLSGTGFEGKTQEALMKQALSTKELLAKVLEFDKRINQRVGGEHSMYYKK